MGRASRQLRHYPKRLGEKLRQIRTMLGLSQNGMLNRLEFPEGILGTSISAYERGVREPPLLILLKYARITNICVDVLLDDSLDLPDKLPRHAQRCGGSYIQDSTSKRNEGRTQKRVFKANS